MPQSHHARRLVVRLLFLLQVQLFHGARRVGVVQLPRGRRRLRAAAGRVLVARTAAAENVRLAGLRGAVFRLHLLHPSAQIQRLFTGLAARFVLGWFRQVVRLVPAGVRLADGHRRCRAGRRRLAGVRSAVRSSRHQRHVGLHVVPALGVGVGCGRHVALASRAQLREVALVRVVHVVFRRARHGRRLQEPAGRRRVRKVRRQRGHPGVLHVWHERRCHGRQRVSGGGEERKWRVEREWRPQSVEVI